MSAPVRVAVVMGVSGSGKTTLAQALAATLGLGFQRVQFTSDLLPADILGQEVLDQRTNEFRVRKGPVCTTAPLSERWMPRRELRSRISRSSSRRG